PSPRAAYRPTRTGRRPGARPARPAPRPSAGPKAAAPRAADPARCLFRADRRRSRPRRRRRESATAPTPPYSALRMGPRAPCELVGSSPRSGAAQVPGDEHERIIRALAVPSEDLISELLRRRLGGQPLGETFADTVGGEEKGIAGSDGKYDRVETRQLGSDDAAPRHETRPCGAGSRRAVAVQQQAFDVEGL